MQTLNYFNIDLTKPVHIHLRSHVSANLNSYSTVSLCVRICVISKMVTFFKKRLVHLSNYFFDKICIKLQVSNWVGIDWSKGISPQTYTCKTSSHFEWELYDNWFQLVSGQYHYGPFTPAILTTIAWTLKFKNGFCTHFCVIFNAISERCTG